MSWQTLKMYLVEQQQYVTPALIVLICAFFIWVGARLVRIHKANILKAILAALLAMSVSWVVRFLLTFILPVGGPIFGFLLGYMLTLLVIKGVFQTSLIRAVIVWFFFLMAQPVIVFFLGDSYLGNMSAFFWKGLPF
jgi:hypothetical protein